jgi:hypothetical protein
MQNSGSQLLEAPPLSEIVCRAVLACQVPRQPDAPRNWDALDGSAAWEHDMFDEGPSVLARHHRPAMSGFKL